MLWLISNFCLLVTICIIPGVMWVCPDISFWQLSSLSILIILLAHLQGWLVACEFYNVDEKGE